MNTAFTAGKWYLFSDKNAVKRIYRSQNAWWLTAITTDADKLASIWPVEFVGVGSNHSPHSSLRKAIELMGHEALPHIFMTAEGTVITVNDQRWLNSAVETVKDGEVNIVFKDKIAELRRNYPSPFMPRTQTSTNCHSCKCNDSLIDTVVNSDSLREFLDQRIKDAYNGYELQRMRVSQSKQPTLLDDVTAAPTVSTVKRNPIYFPEQDISINDAVKAAQQKNIPADAGVRENNIPKSAENTVNTDKIVIPWFTYPTYYKHSEPKLYERIEFKPSQPIQTRETGPIETVIKPAAQAQPAQSLLDLAAKAEKRKHLLYDYSHEQQRDAVITADDMARNYVEMKNYKPAEPTAQIVKHGFVAGKKYYLRGSSRILNTFVGVDNSGNLCFMRNGNEVKLHPDRDRAEINGLIAQ